MLINNLRIDSTHSLGCQFCERREHQEQREEWEHFAYFYVRNIHVSKYNKFLDHN